MPNISKTGVGSTLTFEDEVVRAVNVRGAAGSSPGSDIVKGAVLEFHQGAQQLGWDNPTNNDLLLWSVGYTDSASAPADAIPPRFIGVAMEGGVVGETVRVLVKGVIAVKMSLASAPLAAGSLCRVAWESSGRLRPFPTAPTTEPLYYIRAVAITLESTAADGDFTKVLFDGLNGFTASHP